MGCLSSVRVQSRLGGRHLCDAYSLQLSLLWYLLGFCQAPQLPETIVGSEIRHHDQHLMGFSKLCFESEPLDITRKKKKKKTALKPSFGILCFQFAFTCNPLNLSLTCSDKFPALSARILFSSHNFYLIRRGSIVDC